MINLCYFLLVLTLNLWNYTLQIDEIEELKKRHLEFHSVQNLSYHLTRLKHRIVISALNPHLNLLKRTVLGDKEQKVGIRVKGKGIRAKWSSTLKTKSCCCYYCFSCCADGSNDVECMGELHCCEYSR